MSLLGELRPPSPPWPSLSLPFQAPAAPLQPERVGVSVPTWSWPRLSRRERSLTILTLFSISTHRVTVSLVKTLCKNVQTDVETETKGEGHETKRMHRCGRGFPRAYVGRPETLTPRDLKGEEPLAQEFFLGVSLTVSSDRL